MNRILSVPAALAIGAYCLAAALFWWQLPARPRLAFGPDVQFLDMSKDGRVLAVKELAGEDPAIRFLDGETGRERCRFPGRWMGEELDARLSPDGQTCCTVRPGGRWVVRETQGGAVLIDHWEPDGFEHASLPVGSPIQYTEDGRALIAFREQAREGGGPSPGLARARIEVWDLVTGEPRMKIGGARGAEVAEGGRALFTSEAALPSLAIPIPGRGIVFPAKLDGAEAVEGWGQILVIRRREMTTGRPLSTISGWVGPADAFAVAPDGREIAVGIPGGAPRGEKPGVPLMVRRWELPGGRELAPICLDPQPGAAPGGRGKVDWIRYRDGGKHLQVYGCSPACRWTWWDLRAEAPRLWLTRLGGNSSPDGRWIAETSDYRRGDPNWPGGVRVLENPSRREVAWIGPGWARPVGFTADGRLLLVWDAHSSANRLARRVERFLFPKRQSKDTVEVRAYDIEAGTRPVGRPILSRYEMAVRICKNDTVVCRGSRGFEVWDVLPQPSLIETFGYAAIPPGAVLLAARWRRRRLLRRVALA